MSYLGYMGRMGLEAMGHNAIEDRTMRNTDLIKAGLIAANELGVPSDAKIVHVGRGNVVRVGHKVMDESGAVKGHEYENVELHLYEDRKFGVWLGYSEPTNTLLLRPSGEPGSAVVGGKRWVTRP